MRFFNKRYWKLFIGSVMMLLILILIVVYVSAYSILKQVMEQQFGLSAQSISVGIALSVSKDLDGYRSFLKTRDINSDYYKSMQQFLNQIKQANESIRFIYTTDNICRKVGWGR